MIHLLKVFYFLKKKPKPKEKNNYETEINLFTQYYI